MSHLTYALKISYIGTRYNGWQKQPGDLKTIQDSLEEALAPLSKGAEVRTMGSGRTDTGVHAFAQVVRVELDRELEPSRLISALNTKLPWDIRVIDAALVDESFHPVRDAQNKEYWYILCEGATSPFFSASAWAQERTLNWELMQEAAKLFVGEWDFSRYQTVGTPVSTTVRTIFHSSLDLMELGAPFGDSAPKGQNFWVYKVNGSGFLKQMVRLMVGTLVAVGKGRVGLEDLKQSLKGPGEKLAAVAPAHGLHLHHVTYDKNLF